MESKVILFRCSQLGKLMTEARSKSESISETTKNYLDEVYADKFLGRRKDIVNKYIQKGLLVEEDAITLYSRVTKELFLKNETNLKNDFISGTPDLYIGESVTNATEVIDIKSPWDIWTFLKHKREALNNDYYWQLQGYMWLTGARTATLAYCLVDTPLVLITDQKRKFMWNAGILEENKVTDEVFELIEKNCTYDDLPLNDRVHIIVIPYFEEDILRLQTRIMECREYMKKTYRLS